MVHRIEVAPLDAVQHGAAIAREIVQLMPALGPLTVRAGRIFLIECDATPAQLESTKRTLLADPIVQTADEVEIAAGRRIEVHYKPGVMDPVASSTEVSLRDQGIDVRQVRTGRSFIFDRQLAPDVLRSIATRVLANGVTESVYLEQFQPATLSADLKRPFQRRCIPLRAIDDAALQKLSRSGHLFLSLTEMKAVQRYFLSENRDPTDIELETIAQTWSEHCVHKTLKSTVEVTEIDADGTTHSTRRYGNLIRDTIFASTQELMRRRREAGLPDFCLSVFKDNAGVIGFDETDAVCMKVETHNHPSAIEPYGGAATGIGGCIRDIMGTGLSAKPVASTDVFCVAFPEVADRTLPRGVVHPRRVLQQVVAGVRDYGNRMGIPTVNGAVYFDERYVGNPLVFCGCVGVIPRDKVQKAALAGDAIIVMGGRTGRDGIHGATFSSAELTDQHADEFSHAVQIGNAITQKQVLDVLLQARDRQLFTAVTDCGAGGLSSAVGEMAEHLGATVELDRVPLKYAGLRYDEIWISEAQERMVLSVPQTRVDEFLKLAAGENVEATRIGTFGTDETTLHLQWNGETVGRLAMAFLHHGLPMPTRSAVVKHAPAAELTSQTTESFRDRLLRLLAHPNIASKHWIIRQYDHEVQGGSVIKPLIGPYQRGPSDASVVRPKLTSARGVVVGCGLSPQVEDPYAMAVAAIDEAIRNVVCVGASLERTAILDNFCWPSVDDDVTMGTLVRACEACRDVALAFGTPFISGKDSLHNQFTDSETGRLIRIPPTLLISAISVIDDVTRCVTMDFKHAGSTVAMIEAIDPNDLNALAAAHRLVARLIETGRVLSCHDVSDGGVAVAVAEMCIASGLGIELVADAFESGGWFAEMPGRYLVEVASERDLAGIGSAAESSGALTRVVAVGRVGEGGAFRAGDLMLTIDDLGRAWLKTLDWQN